MDPIASIKSAHDGTTFDLFDRSGGYYCARLTGANFHGVATVYEDDPIYLKTYFSGLAANWRGWSGKKGWRSLEGELSLGAAVDSTGHISLSVQIRSGAYPFDWRLSGKLLVEAGQLEHIAASVSTFFAYRPTE